MTTAAQTVRAAGVVLVRTAPSGTEFLVVHRPRYDDWSLPKGKLDPGEGFEDAAQREVLEETGIKASLGPAIGSVAYRTPADGSKLVRYWLGKPDRGRFEPNQEVDAVEWLAPVDAWRRLSYERDRAVLVRGKELAEDPTSTRVHLIRHADAGIRADWSSPDDRRPLSSVGFRQASAIANALSAMPLTDVRASPYLRCEQTVSIIAERLMLPVDADDTLAEGAAPETLLADLHRDVGRSVAMCSHGDVVGDLVGLLAADGVEVDGSLDWPKASTWILECAQGTVRHARYVAPPI